LIKRYVMQQARGRAPVQIGDSCKFMGLIDETLGPVMNGGAAFAYLFRRFGYPWSGWDDYKDLVNYRLTTPRPDMVLYLRPCHNGDFVPSLCVGIMTPCFDRDIEKDASAVDAATRALKELLRPVGVRDSFMNIHGVHDWSGREVPCATAAGYPSGALGEVDPVTMAGIHSAIRRLGGKSPRQGLKKALAILLERAPKEKE